MSHTEIPMEMRDSKGRAIYLNQADRAFEHYIRAYDARLLLLHVQVAEPSMVSAQDQPSWKRVPLSVKKTPLSRVLYWTWSSTQTGSKAHIVFEPYPYLDLGLKWIPSCIAMLLLSIGGEIRNGGFYDPVRERDRYYSKASRNPCENDPNRGRINGSQYGLEESQRLLPVSADASEETDWTGTSRSDEYLSLMERPLRPRLLCFLLDNEEPSDTPEESYYVGRGDDCEDEYIFVSYTRMTFCVNPKIDPRLAARDRKHLLRFAIAATKAAGKRAFWIDFEGIVVDASNTNAANAAATAVTSDGFNEDVYRICDVLRGAYSMVVINGPKFRDKDNDFEDHHKRAWLQIWGERLWVLPEILLAPTEVRILVYTQKKSVDPEAIVPEEFTKRDLAAMACKDAQDVRQLIDHYSGSILLTPLELVQLALQCLRRRSTQTKTNADLAYALKGLLRRRPQTVEKESGFEAFASLSLSNDSQRLLERLICTLPPDPNADWYDMRDAWGMQLWDIEPTCQVAGVINDRTVLLDGAYGASIRWNKLQTVAFMKRDTAFRTIVRLAVRASPGLFFFSTFFLAMGIQLDKALNGNNESPYGGTREKQPPNPILILGALLMAVSLILILSAPLLLRKVYLGKFWSTQAWFLGIEGPIDDLAKLERSLFGFCENRLSWSSNSSLLSRHHLNKQYQECEPLPPEKRNISDYITKAAQVQSPQAGDVSVGAKRQRLFTLIDTYSLTVTQFYAYHPPTTVFVCGQEGGMQRAVLCSYDWRTQTYCRETVLRMKTLVLERMFRVDRFRFSMKRFEQQPRNPNN